MRCMVPLACSLLYVRRDMLSHVLPCMLRCMLPALSHRLPHAAPYMLPAPRRTLPHAALTRHGRVCSHTLAGEQRDKRHSQRDAC